MRILITGATGYIGSRLAQHLANSGGYQVSALDTNSADFGSIKTVCPAVSCHRIISSSYESIERAIRDARPDIVTHLAAATNITHQPEQVAAIIEANVLFGTLLVEAMVNNGIGALVNTGTFWEYMDATNIYRPLNLYASTKRAFQNILKYYQDDHGLRVVTLRLQGVYGPNDPRPKIFALFKKSIDASEPVALSPGEQIMDMVYIDDITSAFTKAIQYLYADKQADSIELSIGSGESHSLKQIATIYEECCGQSLNVTWGGRRYRDREVMLSVADIKPAQERLGWQAQYTLRKGIQKLVEEEG